MIHREEIKLTAGQMRALTGVTCPPRFLPARPQWVFCIGGFGLTAPCLELSCRLPLLLRRLRHVAGMLVPAVIE